MSTQELLGAGPPLEGNSMVKLAELLGIQTPARGTAIFHDVFNGIAFGNRNHSGLAEAPI